MTVVLGHPDCFNDAVTRLKVTNGFNGYNGYNGYKWLLFSEAGCSVASHHRQSTVETNKTY